MHAHQPRKRSVYEIAKNFLNDLTSVNGGEYLNEPMNQSLAYNQIKNYEDISKKRFWDFYICSVLQQLNLQHDRRFENI